jgi:hypothetical protein
MAEATGNDALNICRETEKSSENYLHGYSHAFGFLLKITIGLFIFMSLWSL